MTKKVEAFARRHNYLLFSLFALVMVFPVLFKPKSAVYSLQLLGALSLGFAIWSLIHHYFDKTITLEIAVEYILAIALVIVTVVYFLQ